MQIVKENQILHKGSKIVDGETSTLADMCIFPGDVLWVTDSEIHENRDIAGNLIIYICLSRFHYVISFLGKLLKCHFLGYITKCHFFWYFINSQLFSQNGFHQIPYLAKSLFGAEKWDFWLSQKLAKLLHFRQNLAKL